MKNFTFLVFLGISAFQIALIMQFWIIKYSIHLKETQEIRFSGIGASIVKKKPTF